MTGLYFKNTFYMYIGRLFELFIGLLSLAIYTRKLGVESYMVVGIVTSFLGIFYKMDIPFTLTLVKNNADANFGKRESFNEVFNTLYNFTLITNLIMFLLLFPMAIILSKVAYGDISLLPFYLIAILTMMISRVNFFLKNFLRANKEELMIQRAFIPSVITGFASTITLMFYFNYGVMSIFVGFFIQNISEYMVLSVLIRKIVIHSSFFSSKTLFGLFKKFTFQEYIAKISNTAVIFGGLFASTFFLDARSIGILTILVLLTNNLWEYLSSSSLHLSAIFSSKIMKKNYGAIRNIVNHLTTGFLFLITFFMVGLSIAGEKIYYSYFGADLQETYTLFLWLVLGIFLSFSAVGAYRFIFISDIRLYNKIMVTLAFTFFAVLIPIMGYFGILGIVLTYFGFQSTKAAMFFIFTRKKLNGTINKNVMAYLIAAVAFLIITLFINWNNKYFFFVIIPSLFLLATFFLVNFRKLLEMARYIIFEIK